MINAIVAALIVFFAGVLYTCLIFRRELFSQERLKLVVIAEVRDFCENCREFLPKWFTEHRESITEAEDSIRRIECFVKVTEVNEGAVRHKLWRIQKALEQIASQGDTATSDVAVSLKERAAQLYELSVQAGLLFYNRETFKKRAAKQSRVADPMETARN